MSVEIIHGDSRQVMSMLMTSNSIDSIVTDPPYALVSIQKRFGKPGSAPTKDVYHRSAAGFMGKQWDTGETAFDPAFWSEALRVLKPGGHVVAFGGTRTYHRLACAIEDAGFEIRDQLGWVYGSGFPKSHNQDGNWEGWGTALKPAWEPIVLARKPLDGTVAGNLTKWGVGAINIDGCRVGFADAADERESKTKNQHADFGSGPMTNVVFGKFNKDRENYDPSGRWPANIVHDGSDEVLATFPSTAPARAGKPRSGKAGAGYGMTHTGAEYNDAGGSAARFFYCAKASRADRDDGLLGFDKKPLLWSAGTQNPGSFQSAGTDKSARNPHPTVKPTDLMRWLCRLITPPGGLVLDPFTGSGSTGRGAVLEGFRFVGVELTEEYVPIARARIAAVQRAGAFA